MFFMYYIYIVYIIDILQSLKIYAVSYVHAHTIKKKEI